MSTTETETVTLVWECGRCDKVIRAVPEQKRTCRCGDPVRPLRPRQTRVTQMHAPPRRRLRPANSRDELVAEFARRGKRVQVTFTGQVVEAYTANGEDLTLIVELDNGRRVAVKPEEGDRITPAPAAPGGGR